MGIWDKVFKHEPSKICGRQHCKKNTPEVIVEPCHTSMLGNIGKNS